MTPPPPLPPGEGLNAAVAAELRAELARKRINTRELAERSEVAYGSLRRYLAAERDINVVVLAAVCEALGVSVEDLVSAASHRVDLQFSDIGLGLEVARDTGKASKGQQRRADADRAGEPATDDPDDMAPR